MEVFRIEISREVHALEWADVEIQAESLEEAYAIVEEMFDDGEIVNQCEFEGDPENVYAEYFIEKEDE